MLKKLGKIFKSTVHFKQTDFISIYSYVYAYVDVYVYKLKYVNEVDLIQGSVLNKTPQKVY